MLQKVVDFKKKKIYIFILDYCMYCCVYCVETIFMILENHFLISRLMTCMTFWKDFKIITFQVLEKSKATFQWYVLPPQPESRVCSRLIF